MTDSSLVISCHCPEKHAPLFHMSKTRKQGRPVGPKATYVDPFSCPERKWSLIKANSKTIVWGENCPVYTQLTDGLYYTKKGQVYEWKDDKNNEVGASRKLFSILNESYRILKVGGKVIFGDHSVPDDLETKVRQINNHPDIIDKYSLEVISGDDSNINLAQPPFTKFLLRSYLYVFTKKAKVGTRRSLRIRSKKA